MSIVLPSPRGLALVVLLAGAWCLAAATPAFPQAVVTPVSPTAEQDKVTAAGIAQAAAERTIDVHLPTLAANLDVLGGRPVRIEALRVRRMLAPDRYLVRSPLWGTGEAVLFFKAAPSRALVRGTAIEVWGRAYEAAGANITAGFPAELTPDEVKRYRDRPVIVVESVRTPEGMALNGSGN